MLVVAWLRWSRPSVVHSRCAGPRVLLVRRGSKSEQPDEVGGDFIPEIHPSSLLNLSKLLREICSDLVVI